MQRRLHVGSGVEVTRDLEAGEVIIKRPKENVSYHNHRYYTVA